jgi:hypothetical protein
MLNFTNFIGGTDYNQELDCYCPVLVPFARIGCIEQCPLW